MGYLEDFKPDWPNDDRNEPDVTRWKSLADEMNNTASRQSATQQNQRTSAAK